MFGFWVQHGRLCGAETGCSIYRNGERNCDPWNQIWLVAGNCGERNRDAQSAENRRKSTQICCRTGSITRSVRLKEVMSKTAQLMLSLGDQQALTKQELKSIEIPVTLLLGSEDVMVTPEETIAVQQQLPQATFKQVEGWQHPIERVNKEELAKKLQTLL